MPDPAIYTDYRAAKQGAAALARAVNAQLLQLPSGAKRILIGRRVIDCATWLAAWSTLHQIRKDQISARKP